MKFLVVFFVLVAFAIWWVRKRKKAFLTEAMEALNSARHEAKLGNATQTLLWSMDQSLEFAGKFRSDIGTSDNEVNELLKVGYTTEAEKYAGKILIGEPSHNLQSDFYNFLLCRKRIEKPIIPENQNGKTRRERLQPHTDFINEVHRIWSAEKVKLLSLKVCLEGIRGSDVRSSATATEIVRVRSTLNNSQESYTQKLEQLMDLKQ